MLTGKGVDNIFYIANDRQCPYTELNVYLYLTCGTINILGEAKVVRGNTKSGGSAAHEIKRHVFIKVLILDRGELSPSGHPSDLREFRLISKHDGIPCRLPFGHLCRVGIVWRGFHKPSRQRSFSEVL
ncbi:MAG: hypothetical protein QXL94_00590 [Candidatus Parvarchaeum sp.]